VSARIAATPATPVERVVTGVGGARLRALIWAPDSARGRVVVVHGLGEHAGRYRVLAEALVARGYAVLAYDHRGHGKSQGARGHVSSFDVYLQDLARVISFADEGLPGSGPAFLYGHSMGGLVVLRHLQAGHTTAPGAILSAPWLGTATPIPRWKLALASVLRRTAPWLAVPTSLDVEDLTSDLELQRAYLADRLVGHRISVGLFDAVQEAQARALAHGPVSMPMLVLVPLEDRITDQTLTLDWAPGAGPQVQVLRLAGMRHEPHNERARVDVLVALADWLDARTRGRRDG
jgi:alpha-beta hydrolase superfamily lysophospholipase